MITGSVWLSHSNASAWSGSQAGERLAAGDDWHDTGLAFTTHDGSALDAANVRKMFKRVCTEAGTGDGWTPRELRTSFISLLSHRGVSIEEIARLVGHASTRTTEIVYRRELRPVITTGAEIMDELFKESQAPRQPRQPQTRTSQPPIPGHPTGLTRRQAMAIQPNPQASRNLTIRAATNYISMPTRSGRRARSA